MSKSILRNIAWRVRRRFMTPEQRARARDDPRIGRYLAEHAEPALHLGCGDHILPGWLNCDLILHREAVIELDLAKPFPLPDAAFDLAFTEHAIEHLSYTDGAAMLRETYRVLKPGGVLRVATPDFDAIARLRRPDLEPLERDYVEWSVDQYLPAGSPLSAHLIVNNFMRDWGHLCVYDRPTLEALLEDCGFTEIRTAEIGTSPDPRLVELENVGRMPAGFLALETMVLEARRPGNGAALA